MLNTDFRYVQVRTPANFFLIKSTFLIFLIANISQYFFTIWTYLVSKWRQWNVLSYNKIYFQKYLLHLHEIVEGSYFHCSFSVCLSVCLCVCVRHFLWTKFQPNGCTDLDAVFTKWLLIALARTLLKLVTKGQGHGDRKCM